jgi:hypothetical protein
MDREALAQLLMQMQGQQIGPAMGYPLEGRTRMPGRMPGGTPGREIGGDEIGAMLQRQMGDPATSWMLMQANRPHSPQQLPPGQQPTTMQQRFGY